MGGALYYRIPGPTGAVEAVALARRIVEVSGAEPAELRLTWRTRRVEAVAAMADRLAAARIDAVFEAEDVGPLLAALAAEGVTGVTVLPRPGPAAWFTFRWSDGPDGAGLGLEFGPRSADPDPRAELAARLAAAQQAGLLSPADVARVLRRPVDARRKDMAFALPPAVTPMLDRFGVLWRPGPPVEVWTHFHGRPAAPVRLVGTARPRLAVSVGWAGEPADEALVDALVAELGTDGLEVDWDCWFEGAVGGYNGVFVAANTTVGLEPSVGETGVYLMVNAKSADPPALASRIAAANGVTVELDDPYYS